jgi:sortase family protein
MKPDDRSSLTVPPRDGAPHHSALTDQHRSAAADIVRQQISSIIQNDPHATATAGQQPNSNVKKPKQAEEPQKNSHSPQTNAYPQPSGTIADSAQSNSVTAGPGAVDPDKNPYTRTMSQSSTPAAHDASWQKYHTAWQTYYQQYYERYYVSQIDATRKSLKKQAAQQAQKKQNSTPNNGTVSQEEAVNDLRSSIRRKINDKAKKVRGSRHFMPIMAACAVMIVFLFLQYNRVLFAYVEAYVSPGAADPESIIVSPNTTKVATNESRLLIPKIAVDVPIVWDANAADTNSLNKAMDKGIVWFNIQGANAKPGEKGNFVVSGHSSNDWTDSGDYKFIFARLEKMATGDVVYANYNGTRYTYKITGTKVVKPTDVASLQIGNDKPYITLITCTPLGTAQNRLLVFGEQISPNPNEAKTAEQNSNTATSTKKMPANSPTFLQRIFGIGN